MDTLDELFRAQYGLITRAQAMASGLSERQIDHRLSEQQWIRRHRSVYLHAAIRPSWESQLLAATLATGGLASHRSGAALWRLELFKSPPPEITIPISNPRHVACAIVHRTTQWDRRAETTVRGIPVTGVERTLLDCGAVVSLRVLERLAESAIRQGKTKWTLLLGCLRDHSKQGRDGCLNLRRLLEKRLLDRTIPLSDFSRLVANVLEDGGVQAPTLEHVITDDHGIPIMQADLAWPELNKAWELDGLQHHFGREEIERDRRKRNRAKEYGWNIQEILWSMYLNDQGGLVEMAKKFLAS